MGRGKLRFVTMLTCFGAGLSFAGADDAKPPAFTPQVSDFMAETQLRHFKLWFAGSLQNWPLAEYELAKIKKSFDLASQYAGDAAPAFSEAVKTKSDPAFRALASAISAKDASAFVAGYRQLTEACNACHESVHIGFIRVQTPTASPFSNQGFAP